ncbi:MAG: adenylate/guanylate cyclase domain-containing protein [Acidobacteria bacterium]|nr:adenylate/guanylate cyclase domain-containing protein [Acidobacteriota bacterium]
MTRTWRGRLAVGCAMGLASAALAWLLGQTTFVDTIELKTYDFRVRQMTDPAAARRDIVLVTIDDSSIRRLEPSVGRWPWPRVVHAYLLDFLARAPARAIVYDVLFTERDRRTFQVDGETWTGEASDRALARSAARAGNVIFPADVTSDAVAQLDSRSIDALKAGQPLKADPAFEARPGVILPYTELTDAAAAVGHNLMIYDADGPVRHSAPFVRVDTVGVPSLALAAAALAMGTGLPAIARVGEELRVGAARVPLVTVQIPDLYGPASQARRMLIRFTGPVYAAGRTTYQEFSFYDLFYAEQQLLAGQSPTVDPARLKDKIVVIGTTAAGLSDLFTVPFAQGKMPGAQIHASVIDNLLSGRSMRPVGGAGNGAILLLCALFVGVAGAVLPVWRTVGVAALVACAIGGSSLALYGQGLWMDMARPMLAVAFAMFGGTAYQYFVEGREKRQVKQVFSRFVSRDIFDQLMADPSRARLGGERRDMTALFADIRGFTTFTEQGRAEDIVSQLNEYFTAMVAVIFAHRGTVDKFVGDMVMALFGAPLPDADHADHGVQAALDMLKALDALNARWAAEGRPRLDIGVGLNTGDMVAGNIGSATIMSYTVIGDAVNLASRLESLNKTYGTHIIISEHTRARLKGRYDMKPLGTVTVKGKTEPVAIFEITPPA